MLNEPPLSALASNAHQPRRNLNDDLYERIRRAIVGGELRPNQRLVEVELAEHLEVSRTPVRQALQRLTLDGLVVSNRQGWIVRDHTHDEIREIYECRMALEGFASRLAAERATEEDVHALDEVLAGADLSRPPKEWMVPVNDAFHDAVIACARNPMLADLCRRSRLYYFNRQIAARYSVSQAEESLHQHLALADAIRSRDGDEAERVSRQHVRTALNTLLDHIL